MYVLLSVLQSLDAFITCLSDTNVAFIVFNLSLLSSALITLQIGGDVRLRYQSANCFVRTQLMSHSIEEEDKNDLMGLQLKHCCL